MRKKLLIFLAFLWACSAAAQVVIPGNTNVYFCPTQSPGTNNTFCASTAFVQNALTAIGLGPLATLVPGSNVTTVLTTATNATGGIMPQPSPWVAGNSVKVGGSGGVADAGYVAMSSTFPTGVSGTVNSGGIPYFNSTLQMSSSGALTQNGVVYGGGAGAAPNATAAGSLGQLLVGTAGAPAFKTPATYSSVGLSNPTGTTNTTGVMMGLGAQGASITPTFSGRVLLIYTGILASNSGTTYTHIVYTYYGTGGAPANGAALTGTQVNSQGPNFNSSVNMGISVIGVVTGLAVGTTYWLDIALKSGNSGATINAYYNNIQAIEF